jgi:hypothetical protein
MPFCSQRFLTPVPSAIDEDCFEDVRIIPVVEPEDKLVKIDLEVFSGDAVVDTDDRSLKQAPEVLHALLVLRGLCDKVGRRMRKLGYVGRTVYFGFRLGSMGPHHGKQITLPFSTDDGETIYNACLAIERKIPIHLESVSQVGVSVSNLTDKVGYSRYLLYEDRRRERFNDAIDHIRDRFGERAIVTGDALLFDAIPEHVGGFSQGEEWEF